MIKISLCMIVKDEEKVLARCLESAKDIVDEIIIVDTGSTDKTKEIAQKYTNNIYDFKWVNDFSKARNYSFSKAKMDYILWLDADDVILEKDREKLLNLKDNLPQTADIIMMKYNIGFDENGNVNFSYYRERLLKKDKEYKWKSPIHEVIPLTGNIIYSDICITHKSIKSEYTDRNLKIFEDMIKKGTVLDARQQYYYARELMYNKRYCEAITNYNIFLNRDDGWIENKINACMDLASCYKESGNNEMYIPSLLKSFELDRPRAEICCLIGIYFLQKHEYTIAIYWFKQALKIKPDFNSGAFIQLDYYNYIPLLNLCYCYSKIGKNNIAIKYNNLALKYKPDSKSCLHNKLYFKTLNIN